MIDKGFIEQNLLFWTIISLNSTVADVFTPVRGFKKVVNFSGRVRVQFYLMFK